MALHATGWALFCLFVLDTPWNPLNKMGEMVEEKSPGRSKDAKSKDADPTEEGIEKEDEEDVKIPDEMPEDAIFIPLGFARQLPQTFYKGTDPEWQSFIEFSKDKKRSQLVRSTYSSISGHMVYL